ncbi:diguanylate cyclase domain-containing protein [Pseudoalteromonas fenneropenaei]|uniref:diguanylate cyclase n=1 Tax=Pseudoalteromonas fenneropenaei TaxID=1737459 RepID=A0ABV7CP21_9GAMM
MANRILIVEDTPTIAKVQKHIAVSMGYEADVATTLAETSRFLAEHRYFCAIVDFVLPDAPQGEAIGVTVKADVPTIVMTGNIDNKTREIVERYPVIDYITKESKQAYHYLRKQLMRLPRNSKRTILVVDDSMQTRHHICDLLMRQKYTVLEAKDGLEALEVLEQHPEISVIIADNIMPRMSGEELCVEVRRKYSDDDIAIIGVSSSDQAYLSARFIKSGANDYIRKPFNNEEFYCRLSQNVDMLENIATIRRQANTDYLTDLPNRRYFFEVARKELRQQESAGKSCHLAMMDIDHFKRINDQYGHDTGDAVLKALAKRLLKHFPNDLVARLGGEEFAIYFTHSSYTQASEMLEQFLTMVDKQSQSFSPDAVHFTLSVGLTQASQVSIDKLLKQADLNLYEAKQTGRNRIVKDA